MRFNRFSFLKIALIFISGSSFASDGEIAKKHPTKDVMVTCYLDNNYSNLQMDFNSCEPNIFVACSIKEPNKFYKKSDLDEKFIQKEDELLSTMIAAYEKENDQKLGFNKKNETEIADDFEFNPSDYHIPQPEDDLPADLRQKYNEARDGLMQEFVQNFVSKNFWYEYFPVKGSEYSYSFYGPSDDKKMGQPLFVAADASFNFWVDCDPKQKDYNMR